MDTPTLIRHWTTEGFRHGILIGRGPKWLRIHYVAHPAPTRVPASEGRYIREIGPLTAKQKTRFNQSVRRHGGKRGAV